MVLLTCIPSVAFAHGDVRILYAAFGLFLYHLAFAGFILLSVTLIKFKYILASYLFVDIGLWWLIADTRMNGKAITAILLVSPPTIIFLLTRFLPKREKTA
ncbi:MAG: hypothetical protein A2076_16345 [Geobacteraceae bacterium GWC2_53_11]|nr:MAG: hypothetical protein A2076_16345 [Geobacteraceae bacterium GWC2_53_11]